MTNDTNSAGQEDSEMIPYGLIINDGSDGSEIEIENPVALRHKMNVGEKTRRAMALKLAGASYANIATAIGYSDASAARKAVQRGMKSSMQENASELRRIHYGRLEHMLMLLWADVNQKDLGSMSAALAVMDRMERLFGLNSAEKIDVTNGRETIILADGDKDSYIKALQEAGKSIALGVGSSTHTTEDDDEDDERSQQNTSE